MLFEEERHRRFRYSWELFFGRLEDRRKAAVGHGRRPDALPGRARLACSMTPMGCLGIGSLQEDPK